MSEWVTAFAPASIGNVGVGFDMLGLALEGVGDRVAARRIDGDGVTVAEVRGLDGELHPYLSTDADQNTASIAAQALWSEHGEGGVELKVLKGIPLQSGMGSSAASAVAAVVAVKRVAGRAARSRKAADVRPGRREVRQQGFARGQRRAKPAWWPGPVSKFIASRCIPFTPVPSGISAVVMHPELRVNTAQARKGLSKGVAMAKWIEQQGLLAGFITACANDDADLIARTLKDVVIEPQRKVNVACFDEVTVAANSAGSLGGSLSGSGPSIFALCRDNDAANVASAMEQACRAQGIACESWISSMDAPGAHVED